MALEKQVVFSIIPATRPWLKIQAMMMVAGFLYSSRQEKAVFSASM